MQHVEQNIIRVDNIYILLIFLETEGGVEMSNIIDFIDDAKGAFDATKRFLQKARDINQIISKSIVVGELAEAGKKSLEAATPKDTGKTASSWDYSIEDDGKKITVNWTNDNIVKNVNIAVILQYGHGTRNGGYVQGIDYINPALQPIMNQMADSMWEAIVTL